MDKKIETSLKLIRRSEAILATNRLFAKAQHSAAFMGVVPGEPRGTLGSPGEPGGTPGNSEGPWGTVGNPGGSSGTLGNFTEP